METQFCAPLSSPMLIECCQLPSLLSVSLSTCIKHQLFESVVKGPTASMLIIISNKQVKEDEIGQLNEFLTSAEKRVCKSSLDLKMNVRETVNGNR